MKNIKRILFITTVLMIIENGVTHGRGLKNIKLPAGFKIEYFAKGLKQVRALTMGKNNMVYAGSKSGKVYGITSDKRVYTIYSGLDLPVGVDYHNGDLYVSEVSRILVFRKVSEKIGVRVTPEVLLDNLPKDREHGWKFIRVGSDKKLYIPVGAPCNICLRKNKIYSTIVRVDLSGKNLEIFARGVRNSVGFDWHPITGELWFTENGRDWMGDNLPPDELNRADKPGLHFGYPFIHGKNIKDPVYYNKMKKTMVDFKTPEYELPAHVAPLGMRFYTGNGKSQFPEKYRNGIFIAEHGSWNRSSKIGYRVSYIKLMGNRVAGYEIFASGWQTNQRAWGRPVDLMVYHDGSLLVSDDKNNSIYRIYYSKDSKKSYKKNRVKK